MTASALFFYSQGRVYALTILGNFAVAVPAQHTPTMTFTMSTSTSVAAARLWLAPDPSRL
jgi:hypothetical protein